MTRSSLLAGLAGVLLAITAIGLPSASAKDLTPCAPVQDFNGIPAQRCELWRGNVPVLFDGEIVGRLEEGGSANWFVCQSRFPGAVERHSGAENDWWAFTMADNGAIGWVSEVWFKGGKDFEADAGLKSCGPDRPPTGPFN